MTLIHDKKINGPVTHAIVIGVGVYSHLLGGNSILFPRHEGMGQLKSPPISACAFANWLLREYNNPDKPLSSLELLISDATSTQFALPDGKVTKVEKANKSNIRRSVRNWIDLGDENLDNRLIFFFCGHGIASGPFTVLLLDDFGEYQHSPLQNTIDFHGFYLGMDKCKAREQIYFVDACRTASSTLIESLNYAGDPIIEPSATHSSLGRRYAPAYFSTVPGDSAYGRPMATSVFTEALIRALNGAGSDNIEGDWRVYTDRLNTGIYYSIKRLLSNTPLLEQVISVDGLSSPFTIHYLKGKPIVPITVGCEPKEANNTAQLSFSNQITNVERPTMQSSDWDVEIVEGEYSFYAKFPRGLYFDNDIKKYVRPPFRKIPIEVNPK